jgi:hypothetical protein
MSIFSNGTGAVYLKNGYASGGIGERIGQPAYRGCPFLNLITESPDQNHPGRVVATIVAELGAADPQRVASQLALIINGACATGHLAEPADLRGDLVDAATKLLAPSLPGRAIAGLYRGKDTGKRLVRSRE